MFVPFSSSFWLLIKRLDNAGFSDLFVQYLINYLLALQPWVGLGLLYNFLQPFLSKAILLQLTTTGLLKSPLMQVIHLVIGQYLFLCFDSILLNNYFCNTQHGHFVIHNKDLGCHSLWTQNYMKTTGEKEEG